MCSTRFRRSASIVRRRTPNGFPRIRPAPINQDISHGLPIAVKDLSDVAGVRTTYGSMAFADHVPERSDYMVERLEANGALVVAKSNTPEFGAGSQTFNEVFGTTTNPGTRRSPPAGPRAAPLPRWPRGRSGSRQAATMAAPSEFQRATRQRSDCGPGPGVVPHGPLRLPFNTLAMNGPMARNVADVALMLDPWRVSINAIH